MQNTNSMTDEQKKAAQLVLRQQTRERLGQRVAQLRQMNDMSIEQLADATGLQVSHIRRIEAGRYTVNVEILEMLAKAFNMTVDIVDKNHRGEITK